MAKRPSYLDDDDDKPSKPQKIDPLVQALLGHLPTAHSVWPPNERAAWLKLLGDALAVIYKDAEPPKPHAQATQAPKV